MLKFHEATQVGVMLLLVRHDPSDGIVVIVELMLGRLFEEKRIAKKKLGEKKNNRKQCEWTKQVDADSLTAHNDKSNR